MALPALQAVQPRLRRGAVVLIGNTTSAGRGATWRPTYLRGLQSGFVNVVLSYRGGRETSIYQPGKQNKVWREWRAGQCLFLVEIA